MGVPLRTLIIEDSEDDALLAVRDLIKGGFDPAYERVESAEAMDEALGRKTWDLIISDYNMPQFSGLAALKLCREKGLDIPFILVSGTIGEETAIAAMVSGAHDFMMKGNLSRLVPAVRRELKEAESRRERKRAEESVQASLREKEVMLREIHHRVMNNMQVISSLFNLQAGKTLNQECREILKQGQTRLRAMSLVHEKLYKSPDLSKIDLATYIENLVTHLYHVYLVDPDRVRLETDFEKVPLDINAAVPCGLILNELISNSLKHAFPGGRKGKVRIGVKRGPDETIILRVADDGIGLPKDLDFRQSESLGLQIVNLLVGQLEAAIDLDRTNGTAFTLTFREMKYTPRN